jgi:hypothetical protein
MALSKALTTFRLLADIQRPSKSNQPVDIDGLQEYWVADVERGTVVAFAIANGGSCQIQVSTVLAGLPIALIEAALQRGQTDNDGAINRWLLQQFSQKKGSGTVDVKESNFPTFSSCVQ